MFNQEKFIAGFTADIENGLAIGDSLQKKLSAAISAVGIEGRKALQKALYAACRAKSTRHYDAARKLWQMAVGNTATKKVKTTGRHQELVAFLRKAANTISKGGDFPAEILAALIDCKIEFEDAMTE